MTQNTVRKIRFYLIDDICWWSFPKAPLQTVDREEAATRISVIACQSVRGRMQAVRIFSLISLTWCSPITFSNYKELRQQEQQGYVEKGFCILPIELGNGKAVFLEDCNTLGETNWPFGYWFHKMIILLQTDMRPSQNQKAKNFTRKQ